MKIIISILITMQVVQAASNKALEVKEGLEESTKVIEQVLEQDIGMDNTCLDEYLNREKELRNWLIWTPPLAIAATPAAAVAGGFIGGGIAKALTIGGWDALGYAIGGGMVGFGAGIVAFVSIEVVSGVRFYYNRQLIHLITESNSNNLEGENLNEFLADYKDTYPSDHIDGELFSKAIIDLDSSGRLCDGSLLGNENPTELKYMLAGEAEIFSTIHIEYTNAKLELAQN
tara:strand:- start:237 stop:926 length:690 start_codon:yes stop_codon:yes gene_type:complete